MAVFLNPSAYCVKDDYSSKIPMREIERLLEANKNFVRNNVGNANIKGSNNKFDSCTFQQTNNTARDAQEEDDNHLVFYDVPPLECSKARNLKVYNRCVFFINNVHNGSASTTKDHADNSAKTVQIPTTQIVHNNNIQSFKNKAAICRSTKPRKRQKTNTQTDYEMVPNTTGIYYLHNGSLRPVLSLDVSSGIYRRVVNTLEESNVTAQSKNPNVFLSPESNGKILPKKQFVDFYNINKTANKCTNRKKCESLCPSVETSDSGFASDPVLKERKDKETNHGNTKRDILSILAEDILKASDDNMEVNREKSEIIRQYTDNDKNKTVVYKVMKPNSLGLENLTGSSMRLNEESQENSEDKSKKLSQVSIINKKLNRKKITAKEIECNEAPRTRPRILAKTRCGRISRPPSHIEQMLTFPKEEVLKTNLFQSDKDPDFKLTREVSCNNVDYSHEPKIKRERNIPEGYTCNYCHKIYLGKRMQRHLEAFPNHNIRINKIKEDLSLYKYLVEKIKRLPEENRAEIFLSEISDLVDQLQIRSSKFVRNTSGIHVVNSRTAKVLGIPEGQYTIDVNGIDCIPDPASRLDEPANVIPPPPPRLDYNLSISLDDSINVSKLNLPDNIITSEDSLLRTVNDLVEDGIKNLSSEVINPVSAPVINYDHASDNAVEAVNIKETQPPPILDLSLGLFQFNST